MAKASDQGSRGCRILIVENGCAMADDLRTLFAAHGIEMIGPASQLSEAMRLMDDDGFDAAVIDIGLHDQLVQSLAEQLERQKIPFVFAADDEALATAHRFGSLACLRKPLEPAEALGHLDTLCDRAARKIVPIDPKG